MKGISLQKQEKRQTRPKMKSRESEEKNVSVMAESTPLEDLETGKSSKHCRYFKMKVMKNRLSEDINKVVEESFDEKGIVFSDKSTSYVNIAEYVAVHLTEKSTKEITVKTLTWVHKAVSNAKRTLLGIYDKIKSKYLQLYLDEFCYKLNRRYFGDKLFDRLAIAMSDNYWYNNN